MYGVKREKEKNQKKDPRTQLEEIKQKLQTDVEDLKKEAAVPREKTSTTAGDMIKYVKDIAIDDPFLQGSPPPNSPFIEKRRCTIL